MNDWSAETAKGYEAMLETEEKFLVRKQAEFKGLQVGAKVMYFSHIYRKDVWATIEKIVPTSAHIGYIVTDKGKQVWASELKLVHSEAETETLQICLNDRVEEFISAAQRAANFRLEVFADWDKNHYVVVNRDAKSEYRVAFQTRDERAFAACSCPDFKKRSRVCKHVVAVLKETHSDDFARLAGQMVECSICGDESETGQNHWDCELLGAEGIRQAKADIEAWRYLHELV
jgi:hypothetical protein